MRETASDLLNNISNQPISARQEETLLAAAKEFYHYARLIEILTCVECIAAGQMPLCLTLIGAGEEVLDERSR